MTIFGIFHELLSTQIVNVARFARNVEWDFFCDFQTPCYWNNSICGILNRIKVMTAENSLKCPIDELQTIFLTLPLSFWKKGNEVTSVYLMGIERQKLLLCTSKSAISTLNNYSLLPTVFWFEYILIMRGDSWDVFSTF